MGTLSNHNVKEQVISLDSIFKKIVISSAWKLLQDSVNMIEHEKSHTYQSLSFAKIKSLLDPSRLLHQANGLSSSSSDRCCFVQNFKHVAAILQVLERFEKYQVLGLSLKLS